MQLFDTGCYICLTPELQSLITLLLFSFALATNYAERLAITVVPSNELPIDSGSANIQVTDNCLESGFCQVDVPKFACFTLHSRRKKN